MKIQSAPPPQEPITTRSGDPIVDSLCSKMREHSQGDLCVHLVIRKLLDRSRVGQAKYGVTLARTDLTRADWILHAQCEALDLSNYLEVLILQHGLPVYQDMQDKALEAACILEAMLIELT